MQRDEVLPAYFRPAQSKRVTDLGRQTLLRYEKQFPDFPKPSRPTPRTTLYPTQAILDWIASKREVAA